ncbi:hypothetical protein CAPTEDRAFT_227457 [Capitella teleta]|uniref:Major facilitator superfamily (MFS) profile domain-containing protein n=1 Tax=Capitella teleta TaxID=283909 RepID=R7TFJ4_CAPTE|nr:hypothetical protein CAPTEDRAFT_227457 [Capitella teleta]|eukprot:ELT92519.1 hypothetical protein CAPTEDRAFT_227457 [Capitella teleta]
MTDSAVRVPGHGRKRDRSYYLGAASVILGGVLVHLTLGTIYTFGNMNPYFTSYIRAYSSPRDLTYTSSIWVSAFAGAGQGLAMFAGGILASRIGPRWAVLLGSWTTSLGVVLTYLTIKVSLQLSVITYGAMFGLGIGIAYAPPLAVAMQWLPERKGLVNGIVLAGFGGGSFIFNQVQTAYINPDNLAPDQPGSPGSTTKYFSKEKAGDLLDRVPKTFLILGTCYALMQFIGVLLIRPPPSDARNDRERDILVTPSNMAPDSLDDPLINSDKDSFSSQISDCSPLGVADVSLHPMEVLKSRSFYLLWATFLFNGQAITFISTLYKAYGQTFIEDDHFLALLGSFSSVFNAIGRIFWGSLGDRISFRTTMLILCGVMASLLLTLNATPSGGKPMFFIWISAIFLTFCGNFALFPTVTARTFGPKYISVNFGLVFTSQVITCLLGAFLTSNLQSIIGWNGMFFLVAAFTYTGMFFTFLFDVKDGRGNDI